MTQILTAACPYYVLQVSDRLVSVSAGDNISEHDPVANKTVVYWATDAIVTIGYSGIAYVQDRPTDEWIAECLYGEPLPHGTDEGRSSITFGSSSRWPDIGRATLRLQKAIEGLPRDPVDRFGLSITMAGWQFQRRDARPIVVEISRREGKTSFQRAPGRWGKNEDFRIYRIGAPLSKNAIREALAPYRGGQGLPPDVLETVLAGLIRDTSREKPTVGYDLLSVLLVRPNLGVSGCRFLPLSPHHAQITTSDREMIMSVAHTPWIVSDGLLYPPSMEVGTTEMNLNGLPFRISGEAAHRGITGLSSSIQRPLAPGRS